MDSFEWVQAAFLFLSIPSCAVAIRDLRRGPGDRRGVGDERSWVPPDPSPRGHAVTVPGRVALAPAQAQDRSAYEAAPVATPGQLASPQAVTPERVAALGLGRRFLSALIDFYLPFLPFGFVPTDEQGEFADEYAEIVAFLYLFAGLLIVVNAWMSASTGRTFGRWIVGGAVLDETTGVPIGIRRLLTRSWWLFLALFGVGLLIPLSAVLRPDRRSWSDRRADAVVVRFSRRSTATHRVVPTPAHGWTPAVPITPGNPWSAF